jgi:hypothetical protein
MIYLSKQSNIQSAERDSVPHFFIFPITICRTERLICNTKFERIANRQKGRKCAIILTWE